MSNEATKYASFVLRMLACEAEEIAFIAEIEAIKARKIAKDAKNAQISDSATIPV